MFRLSTRACHPSFNKKALYRVSQSSQPIRQYTVSSFTKTFKKSTFNTPSVAIGASKILPAAAFGTASVSLLLKKPVHCEAAYAKNPVLADKTVSTNQPIFRAGELTFGTFLGLCTGFLIKKVGKIFAAFIGTAFVFIQYLSGEGYVTVHWDRFEKRYKSTLDSDKDGKVTTKDFQSKWQRFLNILTNNFQFKSTFLVGFYAGMRYG